MPATIHTLFPIDRSPDAKIQRINADIKMIEATGMRLVAKIDKLERETHDLRVNAKEVLNAYYRALDERDAILMRVAFEGRVLV